MSRTPPTASLGLVALAAAAFMLISCDEPAPPTTGWPPTVGVSIGRRSFHLEIAATPETRYQGLSDRRAIAPDGGMLFVFPDVARRVFVMRRCLVPIDLIYLSPAQRVVGVHRMAVEPPGRPEDDLKRYESDWPAQYAIELAGGSLDKLGLVEGQKIDLPVDRLKAR